jgi:group I intron endonuclease
MAFLFFMRFYVYTHTRPDKNAVFYVGKGQRDRAYNNYHRNIHWKRVVGKNNKKFIVNIIAYFNNESDALKKETELILFYGLDNLCNMNIGGLGNSGFVPSQETRRKLSIALTGKKRTKEQIDALRKRETGKKHPNRNKSFVKKMSEERKGTGNPMYGKKIKESSKQLQRDKISGADNYLSKLVFNTQTGIYYDCLTDAANSCNMIKGTLWAAIKKYKVNKTPFIYA